MLVIWYKISQTHIVQSCSLKIDKPINQFCVWASLPTLDRIYPNLTIFLMECTQTLLILGGIYQNFTTFLMQFTLTFFTKAKLLILNYLVHTVWKKKNVGIKVKLCDFCLELILKSNYHIIFQWYYSKNTILFSVKSQSDITTLFFSDATVNCYHVMFQWCHSQMLPHYFSVMPQLNATTLFFSDTTVKCYRIVF